VDYRFIAWRISVSVSPLRDIQGPTTAEELRRLYEENFAKYGEKYSSPEKSTGLSKKLNLFKSSPTAFVIKDDDDKIVGSIEGKKDEIANYDSIFLNDVENINDARSERNWVQKYLTNGDISGTEAEFYSAVQDGKVFHISKLAIDPKYRLYFLSLGSQLHKAIQGNYDFVSIIALEDSKRLLLGPGDRLNPMIKKRFGLEDFMVKQESPRYKFCVFRIKKRAS